MRWIPTPRQWKRWTLPAKLTAIGAYVGVVALALGIVALFASRSSQPPRAQEPQGTLSGEAATLVSELVRAVASDRTPRRQDMSLDRDPLYVDVTNSLRTDPYNVRALIIRGQYCYTNAGAWSGDGYGQALRDFERAARANKEVADPHYGLGTVYYHLAVYDLVKRNLYKVHEKGAFRLNPQTGAAEMRSPLFEVFPDERTRVVLQAALDAFQKGQRLQRVYGQDGAMTVVFFAREDVDRRVASTRALLGYDPPLKVDPELGKVLSLAVGRLAPNGAAEVFDFVPVKR